MTPHKKQTGPVELTKQQQRSLPFNKVQIDAVARLLTGYTSKRFEYRVVDGLNPRKIWYKGKT